MYAWVKHDDSHEALKDLLQVVAVGAACLEQHGVVEQEEEK